ncbi:ferredoxin [Streptomyces sp. NRRL F-4489]|uniref:ferredoxin n=1 Tax=Streptomyces sp. NRRL F-4489 TaxID=1609095 RepID=UPI000749C3B2|nr:ferredoxin [Streptomyces sp. NRRL F-4489]KUL53975.1 ferredoxin [Streptomyces sp. NRRL F-4489]
MRITVDYELCDGLGQCALVAPEVFALNDDEELEVAADPAPELAGKVAAAARACPVRAISVEGA